MTVTTKQENNKKEITITKIATAINKIYMDKVVDTDRFLLYKILNLVLKKQTMSNQHNKTIICPIHNKRKI